MCIYLYFMLLNYNFIFYIYIILYVCQINNNNIYATLIIVLHVNKKPDCTHNVKTAGSKVIFNNTRTLTLGPCTKQCRLSTPKIYCL